MAPIDSTPAPLSEIAELARRAPGLELLVLFGSRARRDDHAGSDWDFAYLAEDRFDPDALLAQLVIHLGERIDLVDLDRANGLLRYRVAAEGLPLPVLAGQIRAVLDRGRHLLVRHRTAAGARLPGSA